MGVVHRLPKKSFIMHLFGTKYLGLMICAVLFILVVGEVTGAPSSEVTGAPATTGTLGLAFEGIGLLAIEAIGALASEVNEALVETSTPINAPIPGPAACHKLCFWNARRNASTGIGCWYRRGHGRGPCEE